MRTKGWPMNRRRLLRRILSGSKNIRFDHIFVHPDIPELVNLQSVKGQAKPYQVKQFLRLVERYDLKLED
jgi:hypothetical protein